MTTKTRTGSKLLAALKSRFSSPAAALRALGLDNQDLLKPSAGGGSADVDVAKAMRADIENNFLAGMQDEKLVAGLLAIMDKHVGDPKRLDDDDPYAEKAAALAGNDDDNLAKFRGLLKKAGLSDADVDEALRLAAAGGNASDVLPLSGLRGGMGGAFGKTRQPGERFATDERRRADYDRRFPNAVVVGFDYSPDRGRSRSGRCPSETGLADYDKRFGGSHIVTNG